jgi:hypothetical protein
MKINLVITTYKRNSELINLINLIYVNGANYNVCLYIFDNNPDNNIEEDLIKFNKNSLEIFYTKRKKNLGPVLNFFDSLNLTKDLVKSKFVSIISDDDYFTTSYLDELWALENRDVDNEFDYVLFNNLILFNVSNKKYSIRSYNSSNYLNVIEKHSTISGTTFSTKYLNNFFDKNTDYVYLNNFMYPMVYMFLFSKKYKVIHTPCIIHVTNNSIHWNYSNNYKMFFYNRLLMFQESYLYGGVSLEEFLSLSKSLISRNSFSYYIKLFFEKNLLIRQYLNKNIMNLILLLLWNNIKKNIISILLFTKSKLIR